MLRFSASFIAMALCVAGPVWAQETASPAAPAETAAPAPLVDMQVTIINQSGQMLIRFEAVPDLGTGDTTDETAPTSPELTPPSTDATATATAPDPRLSAGGELLKGGVVSAGNYGLLTVPGGASVCRFRLLSTLQDGRGMDEQVDICLNPIYTLLPPS